MAITEQTRPYETLIRHNADGSIHAHHVQINEVLRDGEVIAATVLSSVTLGTAESAGVDLATVIGQSCLDAIADAEAIRAENAVLLDANAELTQRCETLAGNVTTLEASVQELAAQVQQLQTQLDHAR